MQRWFVILFLVSLGAGMHYSARAEGPLTLGFCEVQLHGEVNCPCPVFNGGCGEETRASSSNQVTISQCIQNEFPNLTKKVFIEKVKCGGGGKGWNATKYFYPKKLEFTFIDAPGFSRSLSEFFEEVDETTSCRLEIHPSRVEKWFEADLKSKKVKLKTWIDGTDLWNVEGEDRLELVMQNKKNRVQK